MGPFRCSRLPDFAALRRSRGIALEQIAEATKIRVHYLRAIEEGNYKKLPGGVYDLSYIRQYAEAIQCEVDPLIENYRSQCRPEPIPPKPELRRRIFGLSLLHSAD